MFLVVRLQGKFEIDHSGKKGQCEKIIFLSVAISEIHKGCETDSRKCKELSAALRELTLALPRGASFFFSTCNSLFKTARRDTPKMCLSTASFHSSSLSYTF